MSFGRSLELFFVDGRPDGMLTAEVFNWTGHVLKAPRTQLPAVLARPEARHTGVYLLIGEKDGAACAYIGEAENVATRIRDHDAKKDWWSEILIVTTTADALHKAHVKYIEARLIEQARAVGSMPLENGNSPARPGLSEAATANMEEFIDTLLIVLPALGLDGFVSKRRTFLQDTRLNVTGPADRFVLKTARNGVHAYAEVRDGEFIMNEGSRIRASWQGAGGHDAGYRKLHADLVAMGVIDVSQDPAVMRANYAFKSPSAAAAVANGRPANGRIEWKREADGLSFHDWEARQVEAALPQETGEE